MLLDPSELLAFVMLLACFVIIMLALRSDKRWYLISLAVGFLLLEQVFTNIESFFWSSGFNFLEHVSAMAGCVFFAAAGQSSYEKLIRGARK